MFGTATKLPLEIRKIKPGFRLKPGGVLGNLEAIKGLHKFALNDTQRSVVDAALQRAGTELARGFRPSMRVDFETGETLSACHQVWGALQRAGIAKKRDTGLCVSVVTKDGLHLAFERSTLAQTNKGSLDCLAGFLYEGKKSLGLNRLVKTNLTGSDGQGGRMGVRWTDIGSLDIPFYIETPWRDEIVVRLKLTVGTDELQDCRIHTSNGWPGGHKTLFLTTEQILRLVVHPDVYANPSRMIALIAPLYETEYFTDALEAILTKPPYNPQVVSTDLPLVLKRSGVLYQPVCK